MNLKIISFNIRCRDDENGHSISERAPRLASIIYKHSPDIIGFQECRPQWEEPLGRFFGEEYDMYNKYRNKTVDIESSPILWKRDKFEFIKSGYFWLSDTPEIESRGWDELFNCFRMCVYVILKEMCIESKLINILYEILYLNKPKENILEYKFRIYDYSFWVNNGFLKLQEQSGAPAIFKVPHPK